MVNPVQRDDSPAGWQAECERAVRVLSNLLHLAGRRQPSSALVELLRTAPRSPEEVEKALTDTLFCRCVFEASDCLRPCDTKMFREVREYVAYLTAMPPSRRALLDACVAGVFLGWGMGGS
jgi:hypothetical protein